VASPDTLTVAAVQATPVFLDRDATVARLVDEIAAAAAAGAELVVFPEAIVPGYPDWVWRTQPWRDTDLYRRLYDNAVEIPGPVTDALGAAARDAGVAVAVGVTERVQSGSLYNVFVYIDATGAVAGVHRKLIPTGGERTVWGHGPVARPTVLQLPNARVGGLICWENLMPLARTAVYEAGVDVFLAPTWDNSDAWLATLRHISREGGVFVIGVNTCLHGRDVMTALPDAPPDMWTGDDDDWCSRGGTAPSGPTIAVLAGPLWGEAGRLVVELDLGALRIARRQFDAVGHYSRPDAYELIVHPVND
jgi:nitrilase